LAVDNATRQEIAVGVAQFRIGQAPGTMITLALGSCLGIVLYDATTRIGALAHAMHPHRERVKNNANRAKFVDSVLPVLLDGMARRGARRERIVAKIFGGARMFESYTGSAGVMQIGDENIVTARKELAAMGIPLVAECVGGRSGRTIAFDLSNGSVAVRDVESNQAEY
jgi:chemotaxis protein CheD